MFSAKKYKNIQKINVKKNHLFSGYFLILNISCQIPSARKLHKEELVRN